MGMRNAVDAGCLVEIEQLSELLGADDQAEFRRLVADLEWDALETLLAAKLPQAYIELVCDLAAVAGDDADADVFYAVVDADVWADRLPRQLAGQLQSVA